MADQSKKKKTRVLLPGGIQGLVHDLQNGGTRNAPQKVEDTEETSGKDSEENKSEQNPTTAQSPTPQSVSGQSPTPQSQASAAAVTGRRPEQQVQGEGGSTTEPKAGLQDNASSNVQNPAQNSAQNSTQFSNEANRSQSAGNQQNGYGQPMPVGQRYGQSVAERESADNQYNRFGGSAATAVASNFAENREKSTGAVSSSEYAQNGGGNNGAATAPQGRGRRPKENTMREYHITKDDSKDSWDLFLDLAKQYKDGGGKLATIYIDNSLKNLLDRMKYVGPEKLTTSAILSSIVARFIYDHEDDIRRVLFSGDLI